MSNTITWQSVPDYDGWGFDSYWKCPEWMQWYYALKAHYGTATAKNIWLKAWGKMDSFEHAANFCRYNADFVAFLKREKIPGLTNFISDTIVNAGKVATNTTTAANTIVKLLPAALIVVGGALLVKELRK